MPERKDLVINTGPLLALIAGIVSLVGSRQPIPEGGGTVIGKYLTQPLIS